MDRQVIWLEAALSDLEGITQYIAEDSVIYASAVASRIIDEASTLAAFPKMGRRVPEWDDENIRERIVYNYRLIYRIRSKDVLILAVIHGARRLPDDLLNRSE